MTITEAKEKLLNVARNEIGYHESGDNYIKYAEGNWDNQFYGWELQNQPWCDVFVDWCFCQAFGLATGAAITYQGVGGGSALCRASAQFYRDYGAYFMYPEVGDQIFFYYGGDINHTGIVESYDQSNVTTIEGNTSDQVARRVYRINDPVIAGYGRPNWALAGEESPDDPPSPTPVPTPTPTIILRKGDKGPEVRQAQEKLIALGYSCGPDGADGEFGNNTLAAVLQFQSDNNLLVDGEIGPQTWAALYGKDEQSHTFNVGEIVMFTGDTQYVNSINTNPKPATPGKAKVTQINKNTNANHPYHIVHLYSDSNVFGWVDENTIEKI